MKKRILVVAGVAVGAAILLGVSLVTGISLVRAAAQAGRTLALNRAQHIPGTEAIALQAPFSQTETGLVVVSVQQGGAADKAGVKRGDILLKVDGKDVNQLSDYRSAISAHKSGDQVQLTLTHGDAQKTLTATLGDRNGTPDLGLLIFGGSAIDERGESFSGGKYGFPISGTNAIVADVVTGGPADKAGIKQGDVISSVDGKQVGPNSTLANLISSHKPGDNVTLEVTTPGQSARQVQVQLGDNPDKKGTAYLGVHYVMGPQGGFRRGLPFNGNVPSGIEGAVIRNVTANSPAAQAGLKAGDVISVADGKTITTPQTLIDVIAGHKPNDQITLIVQHSDGTTADIKVTLGEDPNKKGSAFMGVSIGRSFRIRRPNAIPGQTGRGQPGQHGPNGFFGGQGGQPNLQQQPAPGNTL